MSSGSNLVSRRTTVAVNDGALLIATVPVADAADDEDAAAVVVNGSGVRCEIVASR